MTRRTEYIRDLLVAFNAVKETSNDQEAMYIVASKVARDQRSCCGSDAEYAQLVTEAYVHSGGTS